MIKEELRVIKQGERFRHLINITKEDLERLDLIDKLKYIDMSNYKNHDKDLAIILLSPKEYGKLNNTCIRYESDDKFRRLNNQINQLEEELEILKKKNRRLEFKIEEHDRGYA
jgi:hypothetical protein